MLIGLFCAISVVSAVLWHRYLHRYILASTAAAATSVVVYQTLVFIYEDFYSPYLLLGVMVTFPIAFVVSLLVGVPIRKRRKRITVERNAV